MKPGCIASLESINKSIGLATVLSPSEVTSVCPGEQLEFTCSTTLDYIQWNVTVFQPIPNSRESFLVSDILSTTVPLTVNMIRFTVAKNSTSGSRPLISTLSVANVTAALNGTMVNCIAESDIEINKLVTIIHVIQPLSKLISLQACIQYMLWYNFNNYALYINLKEGQTTSPPLELNIITAKFCTLHRFA